MNWWSMPRLGSGPRRRPCPSQWRRRFVGRNTELGSVQEPQELGLEGPRRVFGTPLPAILRETEDPAVSVSGFLRRWDVSSAHVLPCPSVRPLVFQMSTVHLATFFPRTARMVHGWSADGGRLLAVAVACLCFPTSGCKSCSPGQVHLGPEWSYIGAGSPLALELA